ncbi:MAG: (d)CMP kinase [Firmicutes bacterium]|nr:(d)CMP kinase [Bacillota bacterium]
MKDIFRIAIDGPSGAGKSTIAKAVAKALNIDYIDTGAMYRATGYKMNRDGIPFKEDEAGVLKQMLDSTDIDFSDGNIILDGEIVNDLIRTPEVSMLASKCSALPSVRAKLVEIQRGMGMRKSVIMDGRDIGTNVLKDAEYKIFLTASAEERARRRFKELQEKGETQTFEEVLEDIKQRDHNDMTRELNPLCKAEDAVELDTTGMGVDEVVAAVLEMIH